MNSFDLLFRGWTANPLALISIGVAVLAYARLVGRRGHTALFAAAMALLAFALLSPLSLLAGGVLFSAHMAQHILLLLFVPGLVLLSLPADFARRSTGRTADASTVARPGNRPTTILMFWALGVGSMWLWHLPRLCNAAATTAPVHALQTVSLLAMGAAFWWPILSPRPSDRLLPGHGIAYLFTACLACTGLGILLTLTPVEVCSAFRGHSRAPAAWASLRDQLGARRDQQIGGLLMWLPMCLVYVAGIVLELARWMGEPTSPLRTAHEKGAA